MDLPARSVSEGRKIAGEQDSNVNANRFLGLVRKDADIRELTR